MERKERKALAQQAEFVFNVQHAWLPACTPLEFPKQLRDRSKKLGNAAGVWLADLIAECNARTLNLNPKLQPRKVILYEQLPLVKMSNGIRCDALALIILTRAGSVSLAPAPPPEVFGRDSRYKMIGDDPRITEYNHIVTRLAEAAEKLEERRLT